MNEQKSEDAMVDIDEAKVDVAVRFLNNSNVKETERKKQEAFLKTKGLSSAEINLAYQRVSEIVTSETYDDSWSIFDYLKGIVLGAGMLSAANFAYKAYVLPYATRELKDDARMEDLIESFQAVKDDIKQHTYELTGTLKQIQALMEENQKSLTIINSELKKDTSDVSSVTELKSELSMIKGMMLNKDQFPATPYTTVNQKVNEIPAWQRIAEEINSDKITEESSINKMTVDTKEVNGSSEGIHVEHIPTELKADQPLVQVHKEELSPFIPLESNFEQLVTVVNDELTVDTQIESDIATDSIVVPQHTTETEITNKEYSSVAQHLELQYSDANVSQVSMKNVNEEQPQPEVVVEQSFTDCNNKEHGADVTITTELNGILYEVVPNAEQIPAEANTETFASELSNEMFLEGTDVLKSEYDLTPAHISAVDKEHNVEEVENYTEMNKDTLEKGYVPSEIQVEIPSVTLPDGIVTSELSDDTVAK